MSDFNPNSQDAILAKILANQEEHGRLIRETHAQAIKTNGRVTALEQEKWYVRGVTAVVAVFAGGAWEYWKTTH
jgi:hypothetical protein